MRLLRYRDIRVVLASCTNRETVMTPDPRSGEDTYDLIDDAVAALADRRGNWPGDDLASIALIASLIEQAERWLPQPVHDARANGHGWIEIARARAPTPMRRVCNLTRNRPSATADDPTTTSREAPTIRRAKTQIS